MKPRYLSTLTVIALVAIYSQDFIPKILLIKGWFHYATFIERLVKLTKNGQEISVCSACYFCISGDASTIANLY